MEILYSGISTHIISLNYLYDQVGLSTMFDTQESYCRICLKQTKKPELPLFYTWATVWQNSETIQCFSYINTSFSNFLLAAPHTIIPLPLRNAIPISRFIHALSSTPLLFSIRLSMSSFLFSILY